MKENITMKRNVKGMLTSLVFCAMLLSSCEEFQPVFTGKYKNAEVYAPFDPEEGVTGKLLTVQELCTRFYEEASKTDPKTGTNNLSNLTTWCWEVSEDLWVSGRITSTDRCGNFYKSFYIQDSDEGPGIEVKIGLTSLYNDYLEGQMVYISLDALAVGEYGWKIHKATSSYSSGGQGTIQIGMKDPEQTKYSTAYIEDKYIIDNHIFRGDPTNIKPITPKEITQLPRYDQSQWSNSAVGSLVTIKGLKYGNEVFALLYINGNESNDESSNRIFLSDKAWNITTWAMTKTNFISHIDAGDWDSATVGNSGSSSSGQTLADVKAQIRSNAQPYSVSQYFKPTSDSMYPDGLQSIEKKDCAVQIRTSGYSKFADLEIDPKVLSGEKTITATGVLTMYQGSVQLILRDQYDIVVE